MLLEEMRKDRKTGLFNTVVMFHTEEGMEWNP